MVQLGVNSPENQKEQELKKPVLQDVVVVTVPTSPPAATAKPSCCSKRTIVCISVVSVLVALAFAGAVLGLFLRLRHRQCIDWGCWGYDDEGIMDEQFGHDYIIPSDLDYVWPSDGDSNLSSASLIIEPYPYPEGDHHGDGDHDGEGDHHGDGDRDGHRGDHYGDHHGGHRHGGHRHDDGPPPELPSTPPHPMS